MEFMGYVRPDGKVGARNYVAVIPSVTCANDVAAAICRQVMGTVTYLHHQGCCHLGERGRVVQNVVKPAVFPQIVLHGLQQAVQPLTQRFFGFTVLRRKKPARQG